MDFFNYVVAFSLSLTALLFVGFFLIRRTANRESGNLESEPNREWKKVISPSAVFQGTLPKIVGESFYGDSFNTIRAKLSLPEDSETGIEVELVTDPNNKFSQSGKAVAVYVLGQKVGHIAEADTIQVYDYLDTWERLGRATFSGRIYFGLEGFNSVQLFNH